MTRTQTLPSRDPDSTDELVRDLEESGYPVDGSIGQFVPRPGGLTLESDRPEFHPEQFDSPQIISTTPSENKSTSRGEVDEQGDPAK
jgi:hypothetical protein